MWEIIGNRCKGTPSANASAGERLGCFVNIGQPGGYDELCIAPRPQFRYIVHFSLLDTGPGPYTYSWSGIGWDNVGQGCTSSDTLCIVNTRAPRGNDEIKSVTVTFTNHATGETGSSTATVLMPCVFDNGGYPAWC